jgi:DNA polymerase-3 subunit beta
MLEALTATCSVAAARTPRPILSCVHFSAAKESVTLTAYDQEVGLRYHVKQVDVTKTGETLVNGERLLAIVRESSDETLAFESKDDHLHVRGADSHFQIVGQNVREFPPVPDMDGEPDFRVRADAIRSAVSHTLFAAARENTRYAINGVLFERKGKQLVLVATDGRRLAMSAASLEKAVGDDGRAIVPTKTLHLLLRLHSSGDEIIDVQLKPNQIILRTEQATISSVLVEGHFPKYEDVLPRDNDKKVTLTTAEFLSAVKRAALLSSIESKGIRIGLGSDGMVLSGRAQEQGEATIRIPQIDYQGPDMQIGFNPEFLVDAMKVCEDTLTMELKESAKPGLIKSGPVFQYVVMPVNLS